jgi:hypothetical protein
VAKRPGTGDRKWMESRAVLREERDGWKGLYKNPCAGIVKNREFIAIFAEP